MLVFLMLIQRTPLNVQIKKFIKRFQYLESKAGDLGKPLMDMTLQKWIFFGKKRRSYSFQFYSNQCSDFSLDISGLVSILNN
jgi:hypothetical protein